VGQSAAARLRTLVVSRAWCSPHAACCAAFGAEIVISVGGYAAAPAVAGGAPRGHSGRAS